ncbi:transmembrane protease serine 6 isoform X1 [Colossoma macropomum]|uniref:transmembrane protease serine 6 isoform X1 n=2 Tax=Colossoma macropomum TaxID=42526 RepID=UPI0018645046|nr:transmembrane protease serine 6 isoform X1 [Colossoma macropomum]
MELRNGISVVSSVYSVDTTTGNLPSQVKPDDDALPSSTHKIHPKQMITLILLIIIILILAGGSALLWYFLEYRVWVLEVRVQQQYTAQISILNRNYSSALSSHSSRVFREEARGVQAMVEKLVKSTDLSRYFNSTTVFAFGEGSVVAYFWLLLSLPESHAEKVTMQKVNESLWKRLQSFRERGVQDTANYESYLLHLPSFCITETKPKVIDVLRASFDCYRYQSVVSSTPVVLRGPNTQRSSCLWHLKASEGSQLELRVEWLLPECRDRLAIYDSLAPDDSTLITSLYGCSRQEQVVQVLSSADWMTVVWKQGQYNYKDPFSLSAQAWPNRNCSYNIDLKPKEGVQGTLHTPFYPSYYPPDTNCTWHFTVPSVEYGLTLEFEGYELSRASYTKACTQGQWLIQNRRMCGTRGLQPYAERLYLHSSTTTVSMKSEVSLTGPGLQVQYSIFNQSDPCPGQFLCSVNGLCVSACDGISDCPSGLDERNCVCIAQYRCPEDSQCVDYYKVCDQHPDCSDGGDEKNCTRGVPCTDMTYMCADGTCLKKPNPACDFITDCPDASDEKHCDCGLRQFSTRVVGGVDAVEGEWPWQASLQVSGRHICGGALISTQWVVSAAHCFYDDRLYSPSVWTVYLGKLRLRGTSQTEEALRVSHIHLHQYYDDETHDYDLALLRLDRPVSSGTLAQPACLPSHTHQLEPGLLCWVTGWGALREGGSTSDVLQKVDVRLVSEDACIRSYGYIITPRMLCAGYRSGGKDACQGDSGGPLVCQEPSGRWFLAGVVSWGRGCGRPDYYGVYTRITRLSGWIKQLIST